jgi:glycerol-3-phosphate O-acyltransferase
MTFSRSSLTLLLLSTQSLCSSAWVTAAPKVLSQRISTSSLLSRAATVEGTSASAPAATSSGQSQLLPEFEAALTQAKSQLVASIPPAMEGKMSGMLPPLEHFMSEYMTANQNAYLAGNEKDCNPMAVTKRILTGISYGIQKGMGPDKYKDFDVAHDALRGDPETENGNTIDYYAFGCNFFGPCMDMQRSKLLGQDNLQQAADQLAAGENVVILANHQSEADPQVVSVLFESAGFGKAGADMVYVAGHKVTTDPLAIPFSMGRNLICIHSKKHMSADPELKNVKQRQNLKAMSAMMKKFKAGGCLLWVAPSGGRDRRDVETMKVPIAPFDSKTIDMFRLIGNKSNVKTHFYTMAMVTYDLCPPPDFVDPGVGEQRNVRFTPVGINMGTELENVGGLESRHLFCENAFDQCQRDYDELLQAIGDE